MKYDQLQEQVRQEMVRYFKQKHEEHLTYHNFGHTESVVARATQIASHYQLNDRDFFIVTTAAWFHDAGYNNGGAEDHELRGADKAEFFLREKNVDEETIQAIRGCIMATRIPQAPRTQLEQIVCDADLYHLGTEHFWEQNKLMRKESEWRHDRKINKSEWRQNTIALMDNHHYQTDYARALLDETKAKNLQVLKEKELVKQQDDKKLKAELKVPATVSTEPVNTELVKAPVQTDGKKTETVSAPKEKKQKPDRPDRGIETMFRISSNNHQRLSDMADNKAHIMITTTSIIISVLLSVLLRKLEDNPHLIVPTMLLLATCVTTMVFSILATRPGLPDGTFSQEDLQAKKVNLLFFGNFYRMRYEEYADGIQKVMNDREFLYGSLTRDVYSQGIVLGRKYRLLRTGYNIFMYGVVASVIAFVIASVFFK